MTVKTFLIIVEAVLCIGFLYGLFDILHNFLTVPIGIKPDGHGHPWLMLAALLVATLIGLVLTNEHNWKK